LSTYCFSAKIKKNNQGIAAMDTILNSINLTMLQFHTLFIVLVVLLHILCAAAIASDIGQLHKRNIPTQFLPGSAWVLAGLLMGLWGLVVYWLMHHSSLAR
jgi:hypothetical protein